MVRVLDMRRGTHGPRLIRNWRMAFWAFDYERRCPVCSKWPIAFGKSERRAVARVNRYRHTCEAKA